MREPAKDKGRLDLKLMEAMTMDDNVKKVSFTNGDLPNCVHVTDLSIELDMDLDVVYEGTVSYREKDLTLFMESSTMQTTAMSQAGIALKFLKPDEVNPKDPSPAGALLADMVKIRLTEYWTDRGVEIVGVEISKFAFTQESSRMVNMFTQMVEFKDPAKAARADGSAEGDPQRREGGCGLGHVQVEMPEVQYDQHR